MSYLAHLSDILGDTSRRREKERRSASLSRLLFTRWGVPVRSLGELESEVKDSGFRMVRAVHLPVSQFVLTRGMLLAQRKGH